MNTSHSAVKRLMNEYKDFIKNPSPHIHAQPVGDDGRNLFDWHFTIKGPVDSAFEHGIYHGRIILPTEYPYKPPDIELLTPNGRFECHKKVCLNMTSYHEEEWHPGCSIKTLLSALRMFFLEEANGIGSLKYDNVVRSKLAKESHKWRCDKCNCEMHDIEFGDPTQEEQELEQLDNETSRTQHQDSANINDPTASTESSSQEETSEPLSHTSDTQPSQQDNDDSPTDQGFPSHSSSSPTQELRSTRHNQDQSSHPTRFGERSTRPANMVWKDLIKQIVNFLLTGTAIGILALLWKRLLM